jgi:hypothetical protein
VIRGDGDRLRGDGIIFEVINVSQGGEGVAYGEYCGTVQNPFRKVFAVADVGKL